MIKYILLFFGCLFAIRVQAQKRMLYGFLQDSLTHFSITNGKLVNATVTSFTNEVGFFRIEVGPGDKLFAMAPTYQYDTLVYSMLFSDTITIYLSPAGNLLPGVTVTSRYTKYQLDSIRRREEYLQNRGNRLSSVSSSNTSGFGIGLNLDRLFKTRDRYRRLYEKRYPEREKAAYIDYRYSPYIVAHFTGLKGEPLREFMYRTRPTYKWLRDHPGNEDVMYYINEKLKEWRRNGS